VEELVVWGVLVMDRDVTVEIVVLRFSPRKLELSTLNAFLRVI
jgi:hypothetical protein